MYRRRAAFFRRDAGDKGIACAAYLDYAAGAQDFRVRIVAVLHALRAVDMAHHAVVKVALSVTVS